jgi:hypothetical protein
MESFATVENLAAYTGKVYTADEQTRITGLLSDASDYIRAKAIVLGKDIDAMIIESSGLASIAKMVSINMVVRVLDASDSSSLFSQESQTAGSYTWSGTYANPGAKLFLSNAELRDLGLLKQTAGFTEMYGGNDD